MKRNNLLLGLAALAMASLATLKAVEVLGYQDYQLISTPGDPASGFLRVYAYTSDNVVHCLTSGGSNCSFYAAGSAPTGSAGGDLSGTYPNPGVAQVNGAAVPASAAVLGSNSSSQLTAATASSVYGLWGGTCSSSTYLNGAGTCTTPSGTFTNPMTTQGDLIYGGSSGTPTRLAAGTSGYILQTNGSGSAPTWVVPPSGAFSQIPAVSCTPSCTSGTSQVVLATSANSVTFASIPGTYTNLVVTMTASNTSGSEQDVSINFNGDTAGNYNVALSAVVPVSTAVAYTNTGTNFATIASTAGASGSYAGSSRITIHDYANTSFYKNATSLNHRLDGSANPVSFFTGIDWINTAAITSLVFELRGGNFSSGSIFTLYGEK